MTKKIRNIEPTCSDLFLKKKEKRYVVICGHTCFSFYFPSISSKKVASIRYYAKFYDSNDKIIVYDTFHYYYRLIFFINFWYIRFFNYRPKTLSTVLTSTVLLCHGNLDFVTGKGLS